MRDMIPAILLALAVLAVTLAAVRAGRHRDRSSGRPVEDDPAAEEARVYRRIYGDRLGSAELQSEIEGPANEADERPPSLRAA